MTTNTTHSRLSARLFKKAARTRAAEIKDANQTQALIDMIDDVLNECVETSKNSKIPDALDVIMEDDETENTTDWEQFTKRFSPANPDHWDTLRERLYTHHEQELVYLFSQCKSAPSSEELMSVMGRYFQWVINTVLDRPDIWIYPGMFTCNHPSVRTYSTTQFFLNYGEAQSPAWIDVRTMGRLMSMLPKMFTFHHYQKGVAVRLAKSLHKTRKHKAS